MVGEGGQLRIPGKLDGGRGRDPGCAELDQFKDETKQDELAHPNSAAGAREPEVHVQKRGCVSVQV